MLSFDESRQLRLSDFPAADQSILALETWPKLRWFYTPYEKRYDGVEVLLFSRKHYWLAPLFCFLYLVFVCVGPRVMARRPKAFDLRRPLQYWNLGLGIFSIIGAARILPHLFIQLADHGWNVTLCSPPVFTYGRGAAGLWTGLFIYSKYIELIDTVFIVLRKRQLNFLHWYHHVTVLMYTWDAFASEQPPGLLYCGMNYAAHAVMYNYYYFASLKARPLRWGVMVTMLQIAQMIGGVCITLVSLRNAFTKPFMAYSNKDIALHPGDQCFISRTNMISAALMYATYFYLFAEFFYRRYLSPADSKKNHRRNLKLRSLKSQPS